jgi:TonB family protein
MKGAADNFQHDVAAARAAAAQGQPTEAERGFRAALGHAEAGDVAAVALVPVLYELAELRRGAGDLAEAEQLLQRALEILDDAAAPQDAQLLHTASALGRVRAARGETGLARRMLERALDLGERLLGPEHRELAGLLDDLSRLHLGAGAYASAEPLLLRLYDLTCREKGEDHADAATVLADLALARQALGRHQGIEAMWRQVLAVRERSLVPELSAAAIALEQLAEACAARGKLAEATQLSQRAETMRELTGHGHAAVAEVSPEPADEVRQPNADPVFESVAAAERSPRARAIRATENAEPVARGTAREEAASGAAHFVPVSTPRVERPAQAPVARAPAPVAEAKPTAPVVLPASSGALKLRAAAGPRRGAPSPRSVHETLMSIHAELETGGDAVHDDGVRSGAAQRTPLAAVLGGVKERRASILAAAVLVGVMLVGAVVVRSRAEEELHASQSPSRRTPASGPVRTHPAADVPAATVVTLAGEVTRPEEDSGVVRARLIGPAPSLRIPQPLRGEKLSGDVRVRFTVDAEGRPDLSTLTVLHSPHELLSEEVRRAIPVLRFEPARGRAMGAPAQRGVIEMSFPLDGVTG